MKQFRYVILAGLIVSIAVVGRRLAPVQPPRVLAPPTYEYAERLLHPSYRFLNGCYVTPDFMKRDALVSPSGDILVVSSSGWSTCTMQSAGQVMWWPRP